MELLRLPPAQEMEPPPQASLSKTRFAPQATPAGPPTTAKIEMAALETTQPFVLRLPRANSLLPVEEGLAALAQAIETREKAASEEIPRAKADMLPLAMPALEIQSNPATTTPFFPLAALEPALFPCGKSEPVIPDRRRKSKTPTKLKRAASVAFFHLEPVSAGARIAKTQPMAAEWAEFPAIRPARQTPDPLSEYTFECNLLFMIEPFRRTVASPAPEDHPASKSGQHKGVRWEFLHEIQDDSRNRRADSPGRVTAPKADIQRDSVAPWLVPIRPIQPEFHGDLRQFDWAQLIARLADFEPDGPDNATGRHSATTSRMAAVARRKQERLRAIPLLGPVLHFWQTQTWAVRGLALAIPVLGFIAVKPSLDGSLREPVVLAKEMPRPVSTVIRREPSKELIAIRGGGAGAAPNAPVRVAAAPPIAAEPAILMPTKASAKTVAPAGAIHPTLVAERGPKSAKPAAPLPIANVEPKLDKFDRLLLTRAAVELADDFSFGLDSWDAKSSAVQWTYDPTGFVRPRGLALYRPSMNLSDYSVEFLAKIDAAAISWVVRAQDLNNYMVVKMVQRGGGPLPRYTIMRYPVVNGREGARIEHPLPLNLYKDTLFRIRMDIRGSNFAVLVQDSVVDSWSDERFPIGGVGFFTGIGEEARIRWVQVTYQNDFIGKLCAWLAPKAQGQ